MLKCPVCRGDLAPFDRTWVCAKGHYKKHHLLTQTIYEVDGELFTFDDNGLCNEGLEEELERAVALARSKYAA